MDFGGLLSLGAAPNEVTAEADAEEGAITVAPTHDSASPVTSHRNQGRKHRWNSDAMTYEPGAECDASEEGPGTKRRPSHLRMLQQSRA